MFARAAASSSVAFAARASARAAAKVSPAPVTSKTFLSRAGMCVADPSGAEQARTFRATCDEERGSVEKGAEHVHIGLQVARRVADGLDGQPELP